MLVLSRRPGEALNIDEKIEVKIIEITNDKVKIGINAPNSVKILRNELFQTMASNKDAAESMNSRKLLSRLSDIGGMDAVGAE